MPEPSHSPVFCAVILNVAAGVHGNHGLILSLTIFSSRAHALTSNQLSHYGSSKTLSFSLICRCPLASVCNSTDDVAGPTKVCIPPGSGDSTPQIQVSAGLVSSGAPRLALCLASYSRVCLCPACSSYKDLVRLGPTHTTSFYRSYCFKGLVTKSSHSEALGLGQQRMNEAGRTVWAMTPSKDNVAFCLSEDQSYQADLPHGGGSS